jgi:bisanhydrobacterioruberin hydratase
VGILFFKSAIIVQTTPLNLLLMFALLIWTQQEKNLYFWLFTILCFVIGILVEMIGVNTHLLFGYYNYSKVLGPHVLNVPVLIGINWFIIIYCCGISVTTLLMKTITMLAEREATPHKNLRALSVIIDGATLAVFLDWVMEPVAVHLNYWQWQQDDIPLYNYLCWFLISILLLTFFHFCSFNKSNKFAVHLLLIQLMFFLLLRTFL